MFLAIIRHPHSSTRFPYTTLFRSHLAAADGADDARHHARFDVVVEDVAARETDAAAADGGHLRYAVEARHVERRRSEEHTSELQSPCNLVCRLLLEKKKNGEV